VPPRYTIRQVVGTYRRKAFGTRNDDGSPRRPAYEPDAIVAFYGMLELAEEQPRRGHFESERLLRVLLEGPTGKGRRFARQVPFLIEQEDLKPAPDGGLDVEGWQILQEGDTTIAERVARFHARKRDDPEYHDPLTGAQRTALYRLRQRVFERDHWTCRYCAVDDYPRNWLVAEHVIPDGPTTDENLVTACRGCNKRKGARTPEEAGMPLLPVTPSDGDSTLPRDSDETSRRDVPARVTSDGVTSDEETVTPRTGDVRAPRRARNAVATATRLPGDGISTKALQQPEAVGAQEGAEDGSWFEATSPAAVQPVGTVR
jgi:HNH endonuclease